MVKSSPAMGGLPECSLRNHIPALSCAWGPKGGRPPTVNLSDFLQAHLKLIKTGWEHIQPKGSALEPIKNSYKSIRKIPIANRIMGQIFDERR